MPVIERIRTAWRTRPFAPFRVGLRGGGDVIITAPRVLAVSPAGSSITVCLPDGTFNIINAAQITTFTPFAKASAGDSSMTVERVLELLHATPFRPFVLHLADGRAIGVEHPEFIARSPSGRTVTVYQPDDTMNIIDLLLVTDLEVDVEGNGKSKGKGKTGKSDGKGKK